MKVQIRQSFIAPPFAPFQIGEELDVEESLARTWIAAGNAVPAGSVREYKNRPSPFTRANRREVATRSRNIETR